MGLEAFTQSGMFYDDGLATFLSVDHERVARAINDYHHTLHLVFIPPEDRVVDSDDERFPYAVVDFPTNGNPPYPVMFLSADEVNMDIVAKLRAADQTRGPSVQQKLKSMDTIAAEAKAKVKAEKDAEAHDKAKSIFRSPLHRYTLEDGRRIDL